MFRFVALAGCAAVVLALSGCGEAPQVTAPVKQAPPVQQVEPAPAAEVAPEPAPEVVEPAAEVVEPEPAAEVVEPAPEVVEPTDPVEEAAVENGWAPGQHEEFVRQLREHLREEGIHPNYGVVDGSIDGPGYLDPDVYGGGPTSGEIQRAHLEEQGLL